jgi:hypothetical protein
MNGEAARRPLPAIPLYQFPPGMTGGAITRKKQETVSRRREWENGRKHEGLLDFGEESTTTPLPGARPVSKADQHRSPKPGEVPAPFKYVVLPPSQTGAALPELDGQVYHATHALPMGNYVTEVGKSLIRSHSQVGNYTRVVGVEIPPVAAASSPSVRNSTGAASEACSRSSADDMGDMMTPFPGDFLP